MRTFCLTILFTLATERSSADAVCNGDPATFLLGSNLLVVITWSVTALSTKLFFQLNDCTVEHGATATMVVKKGCYASTLDAVPDATHQGFGYQVFKGEGETDADQNISGTVHICETGQCQTPDACPSTGDDEFYGYTKSSTVSSVSMG